MRENGELYFLLKDHLSSTSVTVDGEGNKVAELRYKAFGATRFASGSTPTAYQYIGQRNEAALGLYFYNARWGACTGALCPGGYPHPRRGQSAGVGPVRVWLRRRHRKDDLTN